MTTIGIPGGNMYEMLFPGGRDRAAMTLVLLGGFTNLGDAGRVRDGWIERDPLLRYLARLVTRNGGGNREEYAEHIQCLRQHPLYVRDADHEFDNTYASFWFRLPPTDQATHLATVERIARDPVVMNKEYWDNALSEHLRLVKDPAQARHLGVAASHELMRALKDMLDQVR
jgi:hypothetical protein